MWILRVEVWEHSIQFWSKFSKYSTFESWSASLVSRSVDLGLFVKYVLWCGWMYFLISRVFWCWALMSYISVSIILISMYIFVYCTLSCFWTADVSIWEFLRISAFQIGMFDAAFWKFEYIFVVLFIVDLLKIFLCFLKYFLFFFFFFVEFLEVNTVRVVTCILLWSNAL